MKISKLEKITRGMEFSDKAGRTFKFIDNDTGYFKFAFFDTNKGKIRAVLVYNLIRREINIPKRQIERVVGENEGMRYKKGSGEYDLVQRELGVSD